MNIVITSIVTDGVSKVCVFTVVMRDSQKSVLIVE